MPVTACGLCKSEKIVVAIDLGTHPLADTFLREEEITHGEPRYPLKMLLCESCGHAMSGYIVPAEQRYQEHEYSYDSNNSTVAAKHFEELAERAAREARMKTKDLVVDIGGNVGTLLMAFRDLGYTNILNIEPAANIATIAVQHGVPTMQRFFDTVSAQEIAARGGAQLIVSTNSFNHISDLDACMHDLTIALRPDGMFVFEVPSLRLLIEKAAFDTIYLEHISYFAVRPLRAFFKRYGFSIQFVEEHSYMGGSLLMGIQRTETENAAVEKFVVREENEGIFEQKTYIDFMRRVQDFKKNIVDQVRQAKKAGGRVIGVGAATKGNTLLNYCDLTADDLEFISDASPLKIAKYTPGTHIPIKSDDAINDSITHALILPWNIADFLIEKLSRRHPKLAFIVPHV